jgi:hypothetical protein
VTGREFIESGGDPAGLGLPARDWDRLADYVGGALEGTPEEAEVARRVADDPAWGRAYTALTAATAQVSADLSAWGGTTAAMPEDVAARLSAALADAGPAAPPSLVTPPPRLSEKRARGGLSVVPDLPGEPARRPQPARVARPHRWIKWAMPVAAAAAVLGVVGLGINALLPSENSGTPTSLNGGGARDSGATEGSTAGAAGPQSLAGIPVQRLIASGTDYRRGTLATADRAARDFSSMSTSRPEIPRQDTPGPTNDRLPPATAPEDVGTVDPALLRLKTTSALADCLRAVEAQHRRAAARVDLVDYAAFEGSAALVVVFTDVSGQRMVWVSGPNCGVAGDANTLHSTRVG